MYPSDFKHSNDYYDLFNRHNLSIGRLIAGSKSAYMESHADNLVIFNANVLTKENGKVWYGDLDITIDQPKLKDVAKDLRQDLYVLRELDARFEEEDKPIEELLKKAVIKITHENF